MFTWSKNTIRFTVRITIKTISCANVNWTKGFKIIIRYDSCITYKYKHSFRNISNSNKYAQNLNVNSNIFLYEA